MNEEKSLPRGWTWAKLGDVVAPSRETVQPINFDGEPFLGMENVEAHTMKILGTLPSSTMKSAGLRFQQQDVLYGRLRPYLNKVVQPDFEGLCSPEFIVFRPEFLDATLLRYFLGSPPFKNFASHLNAGDRPRVDWNQLAIFPFPLAPLEEQKRIATQLDTLFSELDAGLSAIARARAKVKGFRASLLRAATSGELSAQWRAENPPSESGAALLTRILDERRAAWEAKERAKRAAKSPAKKLFEDESWKANYLAPKAPETAKLPQLPENWCWASLGQLIEDSSVGLDRGRAQQEIATAGGFYPYVKMNNVTMQGEVTQNDLVFVPADSHEVDRFSLKENDILFNTRNSFELVGKTGIVSALSTVTLYNNNLIRLRLSDPITARFVVLQMCASEFKNRMGLVKKATTNVAAVYAKDLFPLVLRVPPLAEQEWIVAEVERRLSLVSEVEKTLDAAHKRAQSLKAAILAQAFRGELCGQKPDDESADLLLKRIREAREVAPKRTKRGKSGQGSLF